MEATPPGVLDRSHQYCTREDVHALLHSHRERSGARHSRSAQTTSGSSSSSSAGPPPIHTLELHDSVFVDVSEGAMVELQRLLRALPQLQILNAAKSNITGRIFYRGRSFRVQDPDKEHVSVEAVQSSAQSSNSSSGGNSSGSTDGSGSGSSSAHRSVVRDDHPPVIIGLRREVDDCDDHWSDSDADSEGEESDSGSDSDESDDSGHSDSQSSDSDHDNGTLETGAREGEHTAAAFERAQRRRKRERRRRRDLQPEIIDLERTPLTELLARQTSAPAPAQRTAGGGIGSSGGVVPHEPAYNYYFYVRTLYNESDGSFLRYYVKLNWLRRVYWVNMSATSISGYGAVSLMASCCSHIQFLFLSECAQLDNTGIQAIVNLTTQLRRLDISHCPKVNRFGLMYLAEFNLNVVQNSLEWIDVSHCGGANGGAGMSASELADSHGHLSPSPQPPSHTHGQSTSAPAPLSHVTAASASSASSLSSQLVCVSLFNALEERGFKGTLVWQKWPRKEELIGQPQVISVPVPPSIQAQEAAARAAAAAVASGDLSNLFAPPVPVPQYQLQLSSPFLQHYQLQPHRIIDLAMRDITGQVLTELDWEWIKAQDRQRAERLARHNLQLGPDAVLHAHTHIAQLASSSASSSFPGVGATSPHPPRGFTGLMELEAEQMELARMHELHGATSLPAGYVVPPPRFYALDLSGHLVNDRLLFYILINWGPRLYSLTLDGIFITAQGLRELVHCPYLHILSLADCVNVLDKSGANRLLKDSLRGMPYLSELGLARSRLSGRLMSSHPNLKLEVLVANGCPISSFAIRMLSSSSSSSSSAAGASTSDGSSSTATATVTHPPPAQNMCKYSLRQLCLSGCAFINRKSVEYIFKFAYLTLLDLSDCKGLKAAEITECFRSQAESEVRHLEAALAGGGKRSSRSSGGGGSGSSSSSSAVPSSFATLLCSLRHLICFGLSGTGMSEKRAADLARDLNAYGAKVQHLLLMQHHQQQAQRDAAAQALADASGNNLAPPMAIRSAPPATPSWLRRDFHADPIIVIAQRNSPLLRNYRPTLTRFVTQQQPSPQGGLVSRVVAVPAGMDAGATVGGASGGTSSPPPLFRGSSLLEDCPYTYLPSPPTSTSNPTAATPGHTTASAAVSPSTTNTAATTVRPVHAATAVPVQSTAPRTFHAVSAVPAAVGAYMAMAGEHAAGGTATATSSTSTSHQNVAALAAARLSSAHHAQSQSHAHAHAQHPAHTWQTLPHSASVPGVGSQGGGGELYSVMQRSDMYVLAQQHAAQTGMPGSQKNGAAKFHSDGFSDEGVVRPSPAAAAANAAGGLGVPSAQLAALSIAPAPRPVTVVAPMFAAYASVPNMPPAPAPALPAASLAFPSVGMPLPASHHPAQQSNLAAPPILTANSGGAAGTVSAPPVSGSVPAASFWGSIGSPAATATAASAPPPVQPLFAASPSVPSVFVSPFAALSRPPSAVAPVGGFASPFGAAAAASVASAPSTPASVSAPAAVAGHVSPLQPGMSLFPDLPDPAAALAAAAALSPGPADVGQMLPADSLMHQLMPPSLLPTPSPVPAATPNSAR